MDAVVRELEGRRTGNARPKTCAGAVTGVYEKLRLRFNAAGGDIGKLRGHGLVHRHDPIKVRQAGYAQWRTDILREIDTNAMRDPDTGGQLTQVRLSDLLRNTYEAIRTNGLVDERSEEHTSELQSLMRISYAVS